ncbi:MAG: ABC transporter permease, partial [Thermomicrobiales bacterium]|nr:ABC transporter permease [Thermomicrobiales bacterium]
MAAEATLAVGSAPLSAAAVSQSSDRKRTLQRVLNPLLIAGGIVILLLTLFVVIYPLVSPYNPRDPDFLQPTFAPSSWAHPLGTDNFGRDTLTRLAYGGRTDILIGLAATSVTLVVGTVLGLMAGYYGGWFDNILMRLVDFFLTMPYLVLAIPIGA